MMKGIILLFLAMIAVGCKSKLNYKKEVYDDIISQSIQLQAKEEVGKVQPGKIMKPGEVIYVKTENDSINNSLK